MLPQETSFKHKDTHRLKIEGQKSYATNQKKSGMVILISNKVDFQAKNITMDKGTHFIIIKWSIHKTM